ncbi:hypothetical protein [Mycolicibacterium sp. XJ1819]
MTDHERRGLGALIDDPAYAGVLCPRAGDTLRIKAIDRRTAELLDTFAKPSRITDVARCRLGEDVREHLVELVLSDVLQIGHGSFVSGSAARGMLGLDHVDDEPRGPLGRLSFDAVRHAARLDIDELLPLAAALYFFGRAPVTPRWYRRLSNRDAVQSFLGLRGTATAAWRCSAKSSTGDSWLHWAARTEQQPVRPLPYKLYVSPTVAAMPAVMAEALAVFADNGVRHFKVGANAAGLARPDKFVAYFPAYPPLEQAARQLGVRVRDHPVHGVPFTGALTEDGMLSWGLDPPDVPDGDFAERASWRSWIALRLAAGLFDARGSTHPWRHAFERLRAAGVDTATWTPTDRYRERLWG